MIHKPFDLAALRALPDVKRVSASGAHLTVLARMGIGAFHLADPDRYDVPNLHRQLGATLDTLGRPKAEVMAEQVLAAGRLQVPVGSDPGVTQRPRRRWGGAPQCGPIGGVDYVTELRLTQNTIREPSPSVRFQR